jgi:hypothetical protein
MNKSWQGYITALGNQKPPASNMDTGLKYPNTEGGPATGFIELIPKNAEQQKKFDAMSGSWEGIKASEAAANTVFKHEFAPVPTTYTK